METQGRVLHDPFVVNRAANSTDSDVTREKAEIYIHSHSRIGIPRGNDMHELSSNGRLLPKKSFSHMIRHFPILSDLASAVLLRLKATPYVRGNSQLPSRTYQPMPKLLTRLISSAIKANNSTTSLIAGQREPLHAHTPNMWSRIQDR